MSQAQTVRGGWERKIKTHKIEMPFDGPERMAADWGCSFIAVASASNHIVTPPPPSVCPSLFPPDLYRVSLFGALPLAKRCLQLQSILEKGTPVKVRLQNYSLQE